MTTKHSRHPTVSFVCHENAQYFERISARDDIIILFYRFAEQFEKLSIKEGVLAVLHIWFFIVIQHLFQYIIFWVVQAGKQNFERG